MSNEQEQQIANLRQLFEAGQLDEATFKAAVVGIKQAAGQAAVANEGSAVAQDHSTAVASRGVNVGERVDGPIVTGDSNVITAGDTIHQHAPPDPTQVDPEALREAYLSRVLDEHNRLLLGGIDPKAVTAEQERLRLSAVYTALLTESRVGERLHAEEEQRDELQKETRRLSAVEQLNNEQHLVILGNPGSGKSTFVNFAAVCLSGQALGNEELNVCLLTTPLPEDEERRLRDDEEEDPAPQPWDHNALLPVCITLREFAARGLPPAGHKGTAEHLWRFLESELKTAALEEFLPLLKKEMLEQGGIFMFDGLDEVPAVDQHRLQIKQVVEDIAATYGESRILVTSRTYAYQKQDWRLPGFADTVLASFSKGQIAYFVDRWYEQLATTRRFSEEDARGKATLLKGAIFGSKRLYDLAERPLLLTLMASLHAWRGGSLPEKREVLYSDAVDLLLDVWEQQRIVRSVGGDVQVLQPSLEQWLKVDRDKVRGLLNRLAYEGHKSQPELVGTADIPGDDLVLGLLALSEDKSLQPKKLVDYIRDRAGLLLPRGQDIFTFPHRTFQEYLAACHLTDFDYPAAMAELARSEPNRWREVAMLAGAKAARGSDYALWGLVEELCHEEPGEGGEDAYWGAHLAGQLVFETADQNKLTVAQKRRLDRLREWLVRVLSDLVLPPTERDLAGQHLAQLGDPRREVTDIDSMRFCAVPAGKFWMGSAQDDEDARDDEKPLHRVDIPYDFWIGLYPVSNAQFTKFVADNGYLAAAYWSEAIAEDFWREERGFKGRYDSGFRRDRMNFGLPFTLDNHPVVGVSWYEALAFTRWLTDRWWADGILSDHLQVTLPSEAQWEKAARGGPHIPEQVVPITAGQWRLPGDLIDNPLDIRRYPWGDDIDSTLANSGDSGIGHTSALGVFSVGRNSHGAQDMSGNVWEWTRSRSNPYPYDANDGREASDQFTGSTGIVLRGGAYYNDYNWLRCACRGRHLRYSSYGFRLVVSPLPTSDL